MRVSESNRSLILQGHRVLKIGLGGGNRALRGIRLIGSRPGGLQFRFGGSDQVLLRLECRLHRLQICLGLHSLLIRRDPRLCQLNGSPAVALRAIKRGLCLHQLCLNR